MGEVPLGQLWALPHPQCQSLWARGPPKSKERGGPGQAHAPEQQESNQADLVLMEPPTSTFASTRPGPGRFQPWVLGCLPQGQGCQS